MSKFKSPNPVGPYSMFRKLSSGGWITSGQIPIDPKNGTLKNNSIEEEVIQVFDNLEAVLLDNGKSLNDVRNNITLIESEDTLLRLRPRQFYERCQCGMIDERVQLMDVRAKIMMLEDERIICFDRCTIAQHPEQF